MVSEEDWTWKFSPRAATQFDGLDTHIQDRIVSKLDEIVNSEWQDVFLVISWVNCVPDNVCTLEQMRIKFI